MNIRCLFILLAFGTILAACSRENPRSPKELVFETIEQKESSNTADEYQAPEPKLIVVATRADLKNLQGLITPRAYAQLQQLDFANEFAIAAFQGLKLTSGYAIQIESIARSDESVKLLANLQAPNPNTYKNNIETSPYHLVKVKKGGPWNGTAIFNLMQGSAVLSSVKSQIP